MEHARFDALTRLVARELPRRRLLKLLCAGIAGGLVHDARAAPAAQSASGCFGPCIVTWNDPCNCGFCGNVCPPGTVCARGECWPVAGPVEPAPPPAPPAPVPPAPTQPGFAGTYTSPQFGFTVRWEPPWRGDAPESSPGNYDRITLTDGDIVRTFVGLFTADDERTALLKFVAQRMRGVTGATQTFQEPTARFPMGVSVHYTTRSGVPWDQGYAVWMLSPGKSVVISVLTMPSATPADERFALGRAVSYLPPS